MLARQLAGVSVLVSPDRYLAGRLAEHQFGATVHVLDDGFQHLQLDRDIDIVIVGRDDVANPVTLPAGRLREPLDTLIAADAIVAADDDVVIDVAGMDVPIFRTRRAIGRRPASPAGRALSSTVRRRGRVAGIASPQPFLRRSRGAAGYSVADTMAFQRSPSVFHAPTSAAFVAARAAAGAAAVLTTEKDYVRLLPTGRFRCRSGCVPLTMEPDPLAGVPALACRGRRVARGSRHRARA